MCFPKATSMICHSWKFLISDKVLSISITFLFALISREPWKLYRTFNTGTGHEKEKKPGKRQLRIYIEITKSLKTQHSS